MNKLITINEYIYSYYKNLFFYNKCDAFFYKIIKYDNQNIFLKDDYGPASHYLFDKLTDYYKKQNNVFIILDEDYSIVKPKALFTKNRLITVSNSFSSYDLSETYYKKTNQIILKLLILKDSLLFHT